MAMYCFEVTQMGFVTRTQSELSSVRHPPNSDASSKEVVSLSDSEESRVDPEADVVVLWQAQQKLRRSAIKKP